jgi:hypothetical protein
VTFVQCLCAAKDVCREVEKETTNLETGVCCDASLVLRRLLSSIV